MNIPPEADPRIYTIVEESHVPRLMGYANHELHVDPREVDALVRQAIAESMAGRHRHHFSSDKSVFRCLCAVLKSIVAAQRQPTRTVAHLRR